MPVAEKKERVLPAADEKVPGWPGGNSCVNLCSPWNGFLRPLWHELRIPKQ